MLRLCVLPRMRPTMVVSCVGDLGLDYLTGAVHDAIREATLAECKHMRVCPQAAYTPVFEECFLVLFFVCFCGFPCHSGPSRVAVVSGFLRVGRGAKWQTGLRHIARKLRDPNAVVLFHSKSGIVRAPVLLRFFVSGGVWRFRGPSRRGCSRRS